MKISYIKYKYDKKSFRIPQLLGFDVFEIDEPEKIDNKIEELKEKKYTSIVISNELASFSENIISKYSTNSKLNIIIAPDRRINS